ncbi:Polysaccharide biosynthesis tyrosine autokinase (plasmid) [Rhodovastum atsumiense]|nr:AAA family ATPase [Rhodovastum atsumiense]CAH2605709.1 Polysaccharide biosynthesis tyrosine autokinase [Rhodovastum atsumiense]
MEALNLPRPAGPIVEPTGVTARPATDVISLLAVISALRRHKRLILLTMLLTNLLVVAAAAALAVRPHYTATATLMINSTPLQAVEGDGLVRPSASQANDSTWVPTQASLLRSPLLIAQVIGALGLEQDPEIRPRLSVRERLRQGVSAVLEFGGFATWLPPLPKLEPLSDTEAAVPRFLERLSVGQQRESRLITVSYRSTSPAKAARVANAVVHQYLDERARAKRDTVDRTYQWTSERLTELRRQLQESEAAATDFMATYGLGRPGSSMPDANQPPSLRRELAAARTERASKEARLAQLRDLQAHGESYDSLPEVAGSAIIQSLQNQANQLQAQLAQVSAIYGDQHPSVREVAAQRDAIRRRIASETAHIVRGLTNEAQRARNRERDMEQAIRTSLQENAVSEGAAVRLTELTRVIDTQSELYRSLLGRLEELGKQRALAGADAELVAAAMIPREPDFPKLWLLLSGGLAGSMILALGLVALAEHLDRGMRASHDVERALGLPTFALVPRVKTGRLGPPHCHVIERRPSAYAEAIRALLLGILHASRQTARVLLVTSAWPEEGKTTLTVSLAAMAARSGRRTVVVDLDTRRPGVARELGLRVEAGVAEYVRDRRPLEDVILACQGEPNLHVVALRESLEDPALILDSHRLSELVSHLRRHFDFVLLDLPPTLGVTDAPAVASLADAALFVVRWGSTTESAALNGIAPLERAGANVLGCVLTQVDLRRHALYGYHDAGQFYRNYKRYFRQ